MWKAEQNKKNTRDTGGEPLMFSAVYQFLTTKKNTKWPNSCRPENSKTTTTRIITTHNNNHIMNNNNNNNKYT